LNPLPPINVVPPFLEEGAALLAERVLRTVSIIA
jgi:hypothetical protein